MFAITTLNVYRAAALLVFAITYWNVIPSVKLTLTALARLFKALELTTLHKIHSVRPVKGAVALVFAPKPLFARATSCSEIFVTTTQSAFQNCAT